MRQLYPEYLGYLKDEEFLTDKATVAYSKLIEAIYKKAKAAAYQKKFDKLVADEIELDEKIEEEKKHLKPESPRRVRRKIGDYEFEADVFEYDTTDRGLRDAKAKENIRKYEQELRDNYAKQSMYSKGIVENYVPNPKSGNKYRSSVRSVGLNTEQKKPREYNTTNIEPIDALGRNKQPVEKLKPLDVNAEMKKIKDEEDAKEALAQEKRKQRLKETSDAYKDFASEAIKAINAVYEAQLKMLDKEIEMRKVRVSKAEELAERGNTEILRMEKEQLEKAQAEREKKAKQQLQLNALIQASNQAVALSEAIGAIVSAAAKGDPYTIALRVAAAVAALVAGIASLTGAFSNAHAYAENRRSAEWSGKSHRSGKVIQVYQQYQQSCI